MFQRLLNTVAKVKTSNNSKDLENEIYSLLSCFNLIESIRMDLVFMNSEDGEIDDAHRLVWNLRTKIDLKVEKRISVSNLRKFHTRRNIKDFENNRFKISGQNES